MFKRKEKIITIQVDGGVVKPLNIPKGIAVKVVDWDTGGHSEPDVKTYRS
jgi:hypothetical protein